MERANLTLQDRLLKELRLEGISALSAANDFVPDYNRRFAKLPPSEANLHRPLWQDEDLDLFFTVVELRKVSHALTLQYDKTLYSLTATPFTRTLIAQYIDVRDYPGGRTEICADGTALPYVRYDRLPQVDQGAIVENKRLGHALESWRAVRKPKAEPQRKTQRQLSAAEFKAALHHAWH